jgi:hypothetical protein
MLHKKKHQVPLYAQNVKKCELKIKKKIFRPAFKIKWGGEREREWEGGREREREGGREREGVRN